MMLDGIKTYPIVMGQMHSNETNFPSHSKLSGLFMCKF